MTRSEAKGSWSRKKPDILANLKTVKNTAKESYTGTKVENMSEGFIKTGCTVREESCARTVRKSKENSNRIRSLESKISPASNS